MMLFCELAHDLRLHGHRRPDRVAIWIAVCACRRRCIPNIAGRSRSSPSWAASRIVLTNRVALCYTFASTFVFGALFGFINSAQQIYVGIYRPRRLVPHCLRRRGRRDGRLLLRQLAARRPLRHAPAVAWRAARFLRRSASLLFVAVAGRRRCRLPVHHPLFALRDGASSAGSARISTRSRMEPLGHVAGTASSVTRLHADHRRRHHRRLHRPGIRRHGEAAHRRLLRGVAAGGC